MASERARELPGGSGATDGGTDADAEPAGQDADARPRGQERRGEDAGDPLAAAKTSDEAFEERAEEEGREEEERRAEEEEAERARPRPGGGPSLPAVSPRAAIARPLLPQSEQSDPSSQKAYVESGPPSSHTPLPIRAPDIAWQLSRHASKQSPLLNVARES